MNAKHNNFLIITVCHIKHSNFQKIYAFKSNIKFKSGDDSLFAEAVQKAETGDT